MHNVVHLSFNENTPSKMIYREAEDLANSGDGYSSTIKFHNGKIYDTWEQAIEAIREMDNGWYDDHAVLYRDYQKVKPSSKVLKAMNRVDELLEKKAKYISEHSVQKLKANFITCPTCGSKLSKVHLYSERCPLCHTDLRAESTLNRIANFDERIKDARKKAEEAKASQKDKAEVKWCVKIEWHS